MIYLSLSHTLPNDLGHDWYDCESKFIEDLDNFVFVTKCKKCDIEVLFQKEHGSWVEYRKHTVFNYYYIINIIVFCEEYIMQAALE